MGVFVTVLEEAGEELGILVVGLLYLGWKLILNTWCSELGPRYKMPEAGPRIFQSLHTGPPQPLEPAFLFRFVCI